MSKQVEIIDESEVFRQAIFRIVSATLKYQRFDGTFSDEIVRLNLDRGDSSAALLHNVDKDVLVMAEQFRYPAYEKGPGWLTEIVAGTINAGDSPEETVISEIREEVGYKVSSLQHIATFYPSPGGSSERIHLYYSAVKMTNRKSDGGGTPSEGEDIRVLEIPVDHALKDLEQGKIMDAKTIIALQWLALNRPAL